MNEKELEQLENEADQLLMQMNQTESESTPDTDPASSAKANAEENTDSQNSSGVGEQSNAPGEPDSANPQSDKELSPLEKRLKDTQEFAHRKSMENSELAKRVTELEQKLSGGGNTEGAKSINSLEELKTEFPELVTPLMEQFAAMQDQIKQLSGQVTTVQTATSTMTHNQQIAASHPTWKADVSTPEFGAWLKANPNFHQTAQAGSAADVVYMLNEFYASRSAPVNVHQQMLDKARQDAEPHMRSQPTDPSQNAPKFTLAQVEAMSMEEFEKYEAEIDQLMASGQLR